MSSLNRAINKPKTQAGRRFVERREPKFVENIKKTLFVRGANANQTVRGVLHELYLLKRLFAVSFCDRKHDIRPFEDPTPLEKLCAKTDSSLFAFGSHSKKRPSNLLLGRLFDGHLLDMFELGVERFVSMHELHAEKPIENFKPVLVFLGDSFEFNLNLKAIKNLLIDFFVGEHEATISVAGLQYVLSFAASSDESHLFMRLYRIHKSDEGGDAEMADEAVEASPASVRIETLLGRAVPTSETSSAVGGWRVEEVGPSLDLILRRAHLPAPDLWRRACHTPKPVRMQAKRQRLEGRSVNQKNVRFDAHGTQLGRLHLPRQDLRSLALHRPRALRRPAAKDAPTERPDDNVQMSDPADAPMAPVDE